MYVFILAYSLFDYAKERRAMVGSRSEKEEHTP